MSETTSSQTTTTTAGLPCWYELGTTDLDAAAAFYPHVLGWNVNSAGMPGFDYRIGTDAEGNGVAGFMSTAGQEGAPAPNWLFYLEVDDCAATLDAVTAAGGSVLMPASEVPGTGTIAVIADPQGAVLGVLEPKPMNGAPSVRAFDQAKVGHGNWHELTTSDPEAGFEFYARVFGWAKGETLDMGEYGSYQLFQSGGTDIGGIMGLMGAPRPAWLSYFGTETVDTTVEAATSNGGRLVDGPNEVPGGAWVATLADPQGATFGIVGPSR